MRDKIIDDILLLLEKHGYKTDKMRTLRVQADNESGLTQIEIMYDEI